MKKFKLVLIFGAIVLCAANAFATAQAPDRIIYNGKEYKLHSNPLEAYFKKFPDKRPKADIMSTGLWRGYIATFEFIDKSLYLKDIQIEVRKKGGKNSFDTEWKSVVSEISPGNGKLKIDWLTGILVIPFGEIVNYVHMGYGSTYENYILLEVSGGELKKEKELGYKEYEKFKERQFEAFKKTEEYKKSADALQKDGSKVEYIDSFLKNFVIEYSSKIMVD
jgi:hypothetical protein